MHDNYAHVSRLRLLARDSIVYFAIMFCEWSFTLGHHRVLTVSGVAASLLSVLVIVRFYPTLRMAMIE